MEFYSAYKGGRPVRLSEETRKFAHESLYEHKYGRKTKETPHVFMDEVDGFDEMTSYEKYDACIKKIAECAPVRICENELISGAATLGDAILPRIPAWRDGKPVIIDGAVVSHLTVDFQKVLDVGTDGIRAEVERAKKEHTDPASAEFYRSCDATLDALTIWHRRYIDDLNRLGKREIAENLAPLPFRPPTDFYSAVQSIWFTFAFMRLCGNWPGIGRLDVLLGKYLKADLERSAITLDRAREILAHFFIKGCEWVTGEETYGGDAQHYQNILIGGVDENGKEVTNEVTYLILDVIEELGIGDFPVSIRVNKHTDHKLLIRAAEVIRHGGGVIAVYGEDTVLSAFERLGYSPAQARTFTNDGCWEVQIPGKTYFTYYPFDGLALLQQVTLKNYRPDFTPADFSELFERYLNDLKKKIRNIYDEELAGYKTRRENPHPCTVISLFENDCIDRGKSYYNGGPVYEVHSPHIGGFADVVNSLYAIRKLVFDDQKISFRDLMKTLENNWEGAEPLRRYALSKYAYFGSDNDEADEIAKNLLARFARFCDECNENSPFLFTGGVSTFGRQVIWAKDRAACPFGKKKNEILAPNLSPTPGTDREGVTAVIRSYCKCGLVDLGTGGALDIRLLPTDTDGERGAETIAELIEGFVRLGGFFMQPDVADPQILRDAQTHPEEYPSLSVRVSGWNARFVTLEKEWQEMIIQNISGKEC